MLASHNPSLLRVIAVIKQLVCLLLVATIANPPTIEAHFPTKNLDCSSVISVFPLEQYELYCSAIVNPPDFEFSLMNRLDSVEMCTCALLKRTMVFEAMVTHEVEFIYVSARKLLESYPRDSEVTPDNLVLVNNPDGIMDFWDRFKTLLIKVPAGGKEGLNLSNKFLDFYTDNYYKPEEFKVAYKGEGQTANFRRELSSSCDQLFRSASPFLYLFDHLRQSSENPRFVYRMLAYNENLYKVMVSIKMCTFLRDAGIVTIQK